MSAFITTSSVASFPLQGSKLYAQVDEEKINNFAKGIINQAINSSFETQYMQETTRIQVLKGMYQSDVQWLLALKVIVTIGVMAVGAVIVSSLILYLIVYQKTREKNEVARYINEQHILRQSIEEITQNGWWEYERDNISPDRQRQEFVKINESLSRSLAHATELAEKHHFSSEYFEIMITHMLEKTLNLINLRDIDRDKLITFLQAPIKECIEDYEGKCILNRCIRKIIPKISVLAHSLILSNDASKFQFFRAVKERLNQAIENDEQLYAYLLKLNPAINLVSKERQRQIVLTLLAQYIILDAPALFASIQTCECLNLSCCSRVHRAVRLNPEEILSYLSGFPESGDNDDDMRSSVERAGYVNGFKPETLKSSMGKLTLQVPQTGDVLFDPNSLKKGMRSERAALQEIVEEMYLNGVSIRKVKAITKQLCGLSSTQVFRMTRELDKEFEFFRNRRLGRCKYLFLDAQYFKVRHGWRVIDQPIPILTAYGINAGGKREVLGISVSLSKAQVHWKTFLESLQARGLSGLELVISDDHCGLRAELRRLFLVPWQRCQFHMSQNAQSYASTKHLKESIAEDMRDIFNSPTLLVAEARAKEVSNKFAKVVPEFASWLDNNIHEGLTCYQFPKKHRKYIRTIKGVERVNREVKRRPRMDGKTNHLHN